ncbi:MAG: hypothetical protein QOJ19_3254 [Acidimicrobiia bacterium]|jgi:hypothetical protein|nr:hypothetical protein [Acidimicrobiia bacterium]
MRALGGRQLGGATARFVVGVPVARPGRDAHVGLGEGLPEPRDQEVNLGTYATVAEVKVVHRDLVGYAETGECGLQLADPASRESGIGRSEGGFAVGHGRQLDPSTGGGQLTEETAGGEHLVVGMG